jgi:E3 ubiquitin-protein ligase NEDD4
VDPGMHQSLIWILEHPVTEDLAMTFSVDYEKFGELITHELKSGGCNIEVGLCICKADV